MPLQVLTRENLEKVAKETGISEEELRVLITRGAIMKEPVYVRVPLPKHLR